MRYRRDRNGNEISQLGFGCMRLPRKGGAIDYEEVTREILHAIDEGINYFDTAYVYPGSEECLGRVLAENGVRDKVNIATKLPQYIMRSRKAIDKTFDEELSRLRTDRIDYYLMHMFTDYSEWENLHGLGIEEWIREKKEKGQIRNIGFSFHGDTAAFEKILNAYDWDFCQIQFNYLDEHAQAGIEGLRIAAEKNVPVVIMEPLRGGKLVNLPAKAREELAASGSGYSAAELGLRWIWNHSEVTCVLSGMNSMEMLDENLRIAGDASPDAFTGEDFALVERIKAIIREKEKVGCTGCRYCMPCPQGVDIPGNFHFYNLMYQEKKGSARFEFAQNIGLRKDPCFASQCIGCGKCEQHCPQHLPIREKLREADRELRPLPYRVGIAFVRKALGRNRKSGR